MAGTRKARVPMAEQIRLINECRQSGMTDADWCRENGIAVSTFYNWVSRCRKAAADQIPAANYGHPEVPRPKQDVVPIDIVPDYIPEQHTASQMQNPYLDNSHTIEVAVKDITVRISTGADPVVIPIIREELLFEKILVIIVNSDILNNSSRIIFYFLFRNPGIFVLASFTFTLLPNHLSFHSLSFLSTESCDISA